MNIEGRDYVILFLLSCLVSIGSAVNDVVVPYDYTYYTQCMSTPKAALYGGGIVKNPEFNEGLKGWYPYGYTRLEARDGHKQNKFIVATNRTRPRDSMSQRLYLEPGKLYAFSAWLGISKGHGTAEIAARFTRGQGFEFGGWVIAKPGCWSMMKGGIMGVYGNHTEPDPGYVDLYFHTQNTRVELWLDSVSLQPFTAEEWRAHEDLIVEKHRKGRVKIQAVDAQGNPLSNALVTLKQTRADFPLGCAINKNILENKEYRDWFLSRFKVTTFENELKWYSTENLRGVEHYMQPDAMLNITRSHGISVRGHTILWDNPLYNQEWVQKLSHHELKEAVDHRLNTIVERYKGELISWDVVNENLHFSFYEDQFGKDVTARFFRKVHELDSKPTLFLNEYNVLEEADDVPVTPERFMEKIHEIRRGGYNGPLGVGLQSHFMEPPNFPYVRAALDKFATTNLTVWLTELDVAASHLQATYLDMLIRQGQGHPAVDGIVLWSAWKPKGCYQMCLTDNKFKNLEVGNLVDKFLDDWSHKGLTATTNSDGFFETSLYYGDYQVAVSFEYPSGGSSANCSSSRAAKTFRLGIPRPASANCSSSMIKSFRLEPPPGDVVAGSSQKKQVLNVRVAPDKI